ncbi:TFIIB-type zinc ribbon-containing protein [Candidatus Woesearchaeota archaeon]|nr:TFIIB-type zinc ribbon-containing protein [Candidatus Woesearchaeota archaeon]
MDLYSKWKKHVQKELNELTELKPTKVDAKCPKCLTLNLEFDPSTGKVHCKNCGYEDYIVKVMK